MNRTGPPPWAAPRGSFTVPTFRPGPRAIWRRTTLLLTALCGTVIVLGGPAARADSSCGPGRHLGSQLDGPGRDWMCVPDTYRAPQRSPSFGGIGGQAAGAAAALNLLGSVLGGLSNLQRDSERAQQDNANAARAAERWERQQQEDQARRRQEADYNARLLAWQQQQAHLRRQETERIQAEEAWKRGEQTRIAREASERERLRREAVAREQQRRVACRQAYDTGADLHRKAMAALQRFDADAAVTGLQQAMAQFGSCNDARNVDVTRRNLELAGKLQAAMRQDGRIAAAAARYASPYASDGQPLPAGSPAPRLEAVQARISAGAVYSEAKPACDRAGDEGSPAWNSCMHVSQAAVIAHYEPEINAYCRAYGQTENADCLVNRYVNTAAGRVQRIKATEPELTYDMTGPRACQAAGNCSMRDQLRRAMNADTPLRGDRTPPAAPEPAAALPLPAAATPRPAAARPTDEQITFQAFERDLNAGRLDVGSPPPGRRWSDEFDFESKPKQ